MKVVSWEKKKKAGFPSAGSAGSFVTGRSTSGTAAGTGSAPPDRRRRRVPAPTQGRAGDPEERTAHLAPGQKDTACAAAALPYGSGLQIREMASLPRRAHAAPGCTRTAGNRIPVSLKGASDGDVGRQDHQTAAFVRFCEKVTDRQGVLATPPRRNRMWPERTFTGGGEGGAIAASR